MRIARTQYFQVDGDGYTFESIEAGVNKLSGICSVNSAAAKDPDIKRIYYIRGIVRNRLEGRYYDHQRALAELKDVARQGVDLDVLQDFCSNVTSWTGFREGLCDLISDEPQLDEY